MAGLGSADTANVTPLLPVYIRLDSDKRIMADNDYRVSFHFVLLSKVIRR